MIVKTPLIENLPSKSFPTFVYKQKPPSKKEVSSGEVHSRKGFLTFVKTEWYRLCSCSRLLFCFPKSHNRLIQPRQCNQRAMIPTFSISLIRRASFKRRSISSQWSRCSFAGWPQSQRTPPLMLLLLLSLFPGCCSSLVPCEGTADGFQPWQEHWSQGRCRATRSAFSSEVKSIQLTTVIDVL